MTDKVIVGLDSWIIQDGNYANFASGGRAAFALEFYAPTALIEAADTRRPSLRHLDKCCYEVEGQIIHVRADWWVIDFGFLAFREETPPSTARLGNWVKGLVHLGVDPFFYFERLASTPKAPALIYDWIVEAIEIRTAPFVLEGRTWQRDLKKDGWKEVAYTNARSDDGGNAEYLLRCKRLDRAPRHRR
jgi:hypothetical protein